MGEISILGAGPAGITAAYELNRLGKKVKVIEKNDEVGGLGRTLRYKEFITDIGPHRFFSKNRHLYNLIESLLGKRWISVKRLTRFYIDGKFFIYPVELKNALIKVGPFKASKILYNYFLEKAKRILITREAENFEDYVISNFGRTLAELNMLNYTEKIWGLPCSELSAEWAKQRIKGLSVREVLKKSIKKSKEGPKTLVDEFYYPDSGTGLIYKTMKEKIMEKQGKDSVSLNSFPLEIKHSKNKINEVILSLDGKRKKTNPNHVISSIPITEFIKLLKPNVPKEVLNAAKKLKFRSHVSLFITLNKHSVFPDQWIYFPDKKIPFGRIMEPKNFSKKMSPKNKTSLLVEFFCWKDDEIWKSSENELLEMSVTWLEKLNFIKSEEIIESFVHREKYAYPVYDLDYKKNLEVVKDYLSQFNNLLLIGRSGSFRYNNQDHALEMGLLAAKSIVDGKRYDMERIGAEQDYFEKGYLN